MAKKDTKVNYRAGDIRINADGITERLTPLRVNEETIEEDKLRGKIKSVKIGYRYYPCRLEWVEEKWSKTYMRMEWAEVKAEEREGRCLVADGKGGLIRCPEENRCFNCKKTGSLSFDTFLPSSIDKLAEEADFDIGDSRNGIEDITWEILADQTEDYIRSKSPESAEIFRRTYNQEGQTEIAKAMGIPVGSMGRKIEKMRKLAQEFLELTEH